MVDTGEDVVPYVLKLFTTEQIRDRDSVCNEVICNELAKQFDLPVPDAALIDTDDDFKMTIQDPDVLEILESRDDRLKFGSELLEGFNLMKIDAFNSSQARRMMKLGSLFAFDVLVRNRDRNRSKTNLLIKSNESVLIDHELAFEQLNSQVLEGFRQLAWNPDFYQYHLAYNYLKRSRKATKLHYFDEFGEYLRFLNINVLGSYFEQLRQYGFSNAKHEMIRDYLAEIKASSGNFVNILKGAIG